MALKDPFAQACLDRLSEIGAVWARAMFGGYGFYFEDVFFAVIVEDGRLHFKADDLTVGKFEAAGAEQWIWEGDLERGPVRMNYWSPLGDVLEDLGVLETWVRLAVEAGRRGAGKKKKR